MKTTQRLLSILLSLMMIFSVFSVIPGSASAQTVGYDDSDGSADSLRIERRAGGDDSDLAVTGADADLAETGHYNISVGKKVITSDNYRDVYGDGTVKYNPSTKVLTLNNPDPKKLEGAYAEDYGMVHVNDSGVTVTGTYHMDKAYSLYGIAGDFTVKINGNFTFYGSQTGAQANESIIINGGNVTCYGSENGITARELTVNAGNLKSVATGSGDTDGILVDNITIGNNITRIEARGASSAVVCDGIEFNKTRITSPADAFFHPWDRSIVKPDLSGTATSAVIEPFGGSYYDVWVGSRHVDSENYTDIFGDGKASYDPGTKTLTLSDPTLIGGYVQSDSNTNNFFRIYALDDLTVKGSYHMTADDLHLYTYFDEEEGTEKEKKLYGGIYSGSDLTLDGSFSFAGEKFCVYAEKNLNIQSGSLKAFGSENIGLRGDVIDIAKTVSKIDAEASYPFYGASNIGLSNQLTFTAPSNAGLAKDTVDGYVYVIDLDTNKPAKHVVLEYQGPVTNYNVYLGTKQVTSKNMDDIFGDGKAKYEPSTGTLTLNNPTITGVYPNSGNTYKIYSQEDLTVKGSYNMAQSESNFGIRSDNNLILDGDFTFRGTDFAIYSYQGSITLKSGSITGVSDGTFGALAVDGDFKVESGVTKADITAGVVAAAGKDIKLGTGATITTPSNYAVATDQNAGIKGIYDRDASSYAKHVVIEYRETVTYYNVFVGSVQVSSKNKNDILGDGGKAKYDPDTKTLTLDNPTVGDTTTQASNTMKIFAKDDLTLKGYFAMPSADASIGVYSGKTLTLDGFFDFKGSSYAVYALESLTISSGSLTAEGGAPIGVIALRGSFTVANGVAKVDITGKKYAFLSKEINIGGDPTVIEPSNWEIKTDSAYSLDGVYDNDASSFAKHVVIGTKTTPTEPPTDEPTQEPTQKATEPYVCSPGYYLAGTMNDWKVDRNYRLRANLYSEYDESYLDYVELKTTDQFKIGYTSDGVNFDEIEWYPEGMGNNYGKNGEIKADGAYVVYFRRNYDGGEDWFCGCIFVQPYEEPTEVPPTQEPTQPSETKYNLWLGSTQVTGANKDDILNDGGKAKFDPDTNTLTLNNPTIEGTKVINEYSDSCKIYSGINLTLKGSYHMTGEEADYGFYSDDYITFSGDFTFIGSYTGVSGNKYTIVESGKLKAVGGEFGDGLSSNWELFVKKDVERLELQGDFAAYSGNKIILDDGISVVDPEGGYFDLDNIVDSVGNRVKYAVIGKVVAISGLNGKGTASEPYIISSTEDWNTLAELIDNGAYISGKHFKLTNNISVSKMLGTESNPFSGTFDGDGHTLTLGLSSDDSFCAPFSCIKDATVKNLKTDGTVSGGMHCSGLAGRLQGDNLIENCVVDVDIACSQNHCGGLVGHGVDSNTTLRGCVFTGSFTGGSRIGALWGWSDSGDHVIENCLDLSDSTYPIGLGNPRNPTVTNTYYITNKDMSADYGRPWNESSRGKLAYTVSGDGITLKGAPGVAFDGKIYAAEDERINLTAADAGSIYIPSGGAIYKNDNALTLTMPGADVTVKKTKATVYNSYTDAVGTGGNNNEEPDKLVDGKTSTKWCYSSKNLPITLTFRSEEAITPIGYLLITANDTKKFPDRNPKSWKLEASADGENWTALSEVVDSSILEGENYKPYTFPLDNPDENEYSYFRFTVNDTVGSDCFQLSELQLINGEYKEYNLWLGSTQVTSANKNDILDDGGKAKFDPKTGTLTLSDPNISDTHNYAKIYSELNMDLTLKGSYHMSAKETDYGFYSKNYVVFSGNFTFCGNTYGVNDRKYTTVLSGKLKAVGDRVGLFSLWELYVKKGIERLEMEGGSRCYDGNSIKLDKGTILTEPEGGRVDDKIILESDGSAAKRAVIEKKPVTAYNLWVGSTQVTSENMDDILEDGGKAKFDPETNTLTLSDPVINDTHSRKKIYSDINLTIKGSYHMTEFESVGALFCSDCITFSGDFTFLSNNFEAIVSRKNIWVKSGKLKAGSQSIYGIYSFMGMYVEEDVERLEIKGNLICYSGGDLVLDDSMTITEPEGAYIKGNTVYKSDDNYADRVIIEPKPPMILGDIDGDGEATILDATLAQRHATRVSIPYTKEQIKSGDVDREGEVTIIDATFIQRYATRIKVPYPIGEPIRK